MNCKFPVLSAENFSEKFLDKKILKEKTFMLNSKKKISVQAKIEEILIERDYFSELGCKYSAKYYRDKINSLSISQFSECNCGCMRFDDGKRIKCKCGYIGCSMCGDFIECENGHTCDSMIVESVKEINANSRSCPGCGIRIFKREGCYQIMCSECGCVFNYNTGELDTGGIHAPEIYDRVRKLELDAKLKPLDWKSIHDSRIVYVFYKVSTLVAKSLNELSINEKNRISYLKGETCSTLYRENTFISYMIYYHKKKEAMLLLLEARNILKRTS